MRFHIYPAVLILIFIPHATPAALPNTSAVPGGVARIELGPADRPAPQVFYGERPVMDKN